MCLGGIAVLAESWEDGGTRVGRLDTGKVVSLAFVPEARTGATLLVHLGIPVEVLAPEDAAEALALRTDNRTDKGET